MDRNEAFELLKFLEDNQYLAGSLTAELLIEVVADENEFNHISGKNPIEEIGVKNDGDM